MIKSITSLSILSSVALSFAATADPIPGDAPAELTGTISAFQKTFPEGEVLVKDMNLSGTPEVLLLSTPGCEGSCEFSLISYDSGHALEVHAGFAEAVAFVETQGETSLIEIDHVTWAFDEEVYPFGDVIQDKSPASASFQEVEAARGQEYFENSDRSDFESYNFQYSSAGEMKDAFVLVNRDSHQQVGVWGSRYLIMTREGEIIHAGLSAEYPRIFLHQDEDGFTVLDVYPNSYAVEVFR